jgi:CHAD domain-containing protein
MVAVNKQSPAYIIHRFFKRLTKYSAKIKEDDSGEAIHLFRIEIKKLRAFLRLLSLELKEDDELKLPPEIKKMYKYAGKLRERQLHRKRIKAAVKNNQPPLRSIRRNWKVDTKKKAGEHKWLSGKDFSAAELKLKRKLPHEPGNDAVNAFFRLKIDNILTFIYKGSYTTSELHAIRKSLKDIIYTIKLYRTEMKVNLSFIFRDKRGEEMAERLAHELGAYNDLCRDIAFLKNAMKKNDDHNAKKEMQSLYNIWLAGKRKLKKKIVKSIQMPHLFKM